MAATLGNGNITFGDSTTQSTAALPLTGGTLTGALSGTSISTTGNVTIGGALAANGGVTLGDAAADALTITSNTATVNNTLTLAYDAATTNTVVDILTLRRTSSGTPANGIGVGLAFQVETTANNNEIGATIDAVVADITAASEDFDIVFSSMTAGAAATEKLRIRYDGNIGIGTTIPALGKLSILKSSTWNNEASSGISIISSDSNATASLGIGADNTNSVTYIQAVSKGTSYDYKLALNPNGGRVGIGTITPGYTLDVNGSARVNGSLYINAGAGNWGANYANTTASSFKSFYKGGSTSTIVGYIGSDGGGISSGGSGNNFGIRADGELILMAGASDNTRITTSASIRNYRGAFATSSGTRYTLSVGSVGNINLVAASAAGASPTAANQYGITFQPNADDTQAGIIFSENGVDGVGVGIFASEAYATGPKLSFAVSPQGYISSPRSPRFYAWANEYYPTTRTYTTEVTWYSGTSNGIYIPVNIGSCFNYTNGRFTAPIAGHYQFFGYFSRCGGNATIDIYKNGGTSGCRALSYGLDWQTASVSNILYLEVGDYVHLSIGATNATTTQGCYVTFSGQLIG